MSSDFSVRYLRIELNLTEPTSLLSVGLFRTGIQSDLFIWALLEIRETISI